MTIIHGDNGNMFNAEMVLNDTEDRSGHLMLARELLKQRNEMYKMLEECRDFVSLDENCGPFGLGLVVMIDDLLTKARGEEL